ncbi:unnamed protein product [Ascophyllum nodosum]
MCFVVIKYSRKQKLYFIFEAGPCISDSCSPALPWFRGGVMCFVVIKLYFITWTSMLLSYVCVLAFGFVD